MFEIDSFGANVANCCINNYLLLLFFFSQTKRKDFAYCEVYGILMGGGGGGGVWFIEQNICNELTIHVTFGVWSMHMRNESEHKNEKQSA